MKTIASVSILLLLVSVGVALEFNLTSTNTFNTALSAIVSNYASPSIDVFLTDSEYSGCDTITLSKVLSITGNGASVLTCSSLISNLFLCQNCRLTVRNLTIVVNGTNEAGALVTSTNDADSVEFENVVVSAQAQSGTPPLKLFSVSAGSMTVTSSYFHNIIVQNGIFVVDKDPAILTVENCVFEDVIGTTYSSVLFVNSGGVASLKDVEVSRAQGNLGGVFSVWFGVLTTENLTTTDCSASVAGGVGYMYAESNEGEVVMNQGTHTNSSSVGGGFIWLSGLSHMVINGSSIIESSAIQGGSFYMSNGELEVWSSSFTDTAAVTSGSALGLGGLIASDNFQSVATFSNVSVLESSTTGQGSIAYLNSGTLDFDDCYVVDSMSSNALFVALAADIYLSFVSVSDVTTANYGVLWAAQNGRIFVEDSTIQDVFSTGDGLAFIKKKGKVVMNRVTISSVSALNGAFIVDPDSDTSTAGFGYLALRHTNLENLSVGDGRPLIDLRGSATSHLAVNVYAQNISVVGGSAKAVFSFETTSPGLVVDGVSMCTNVPLIVCESAAVCANVYMYSLDIDATCTPSNSNVCEGLLASSIQYELCVNVTGAQRELPFEYLSSYWIAVTPSSPSSSASPESPSSLSSSSESSPSLSSSSSSSESNSVDEVTRGKLNTAVVVGLSAAVFIGIVIIVVLLLVVVKQRKSTTVSPLDTQPLSQPPSTNTGSAAAGTGSGGTGKK